MSHDEQEMQKIRAQRLRAQIAKLKSGETGPKQGDARPESPHDFVQRRMREKAREEHKQEGQE